jgi:hypothetical protein
MNSDENSYLPDPFVKGMQYIHKDGVTKIWAIEMDTTFAVNTDWGIEQGRSGDFLCKFKQNMWRVGRQVFLEYFKPTSLRKVLPPPAAISENDPER